MNRNEIRTQFKKNFPKIAEVVSNDPSYNFLYNNENLGKNLIFLTLGGSYAYGTNIEGSDIDVRGISLNTKREILLGRDHEQSINEATDTVIYTTKKILQLLSQCNPNTIEAVGSIERNALYIHPIFEENILNNMKLFLSKEAFYSFAGYANSQLSRLFNKLGRNEEKIEQQNILRSIDNSSKHMKERYGVDVKILFPIEKQDGLYIIGREDNNFDLIFKNVTKENAQSFLNELSSIFKDYNKLGKRNKNAIEKGKLGKHFMHLIRLTYMGYDILVNQEVITHREKEHDLLMSIRNNENNEWITQDNHITEKGENLIKERMKTLENAKDISKLPDKKDINKMENILININSFIINQ